MDGHAAVHGLAHVVDGEQGNLHGGEGLHLDAGGADGFHGCGTKYACSALLAGDGGRWQSGLTMHNERSDKGQK